ncbi:MAG: glycosyltransferase family 39 protein [Candidatus Sumerlaeia bacterium]|nr:glycosyltransferase family 39 protein [Candidatus Sumerlaeia bacterium]
MPQEPDRYRRWVLGVMGASVLLRLLYLAASPLGLASDEVYYWVWSQHPALSYFSKGPLVAYLIGASTAVLGDSALGIRAPSILFSTLTMWWVFQIGRELFGSARTGFWAAVVFLCIPVFNVGGLIMTIDNPVFCAWAAMMLFTHRALQGNGLANWVLAGIAFGIGIMAKAVIVFAIPSILLWLLLTGRRGVLRTAGPYVCLAIGLLFFLPQLYWNSQNGFTMFADFARKAGAGKSLSINLGHPLEFLAIQAGILSPLLFPVVVLGMWESWKRRGERQSAWPVALATWLPMVAVYLTMSLWKDLNANWTILSYLFPIVGGTHAVLSRMDSSAKPAVWRRAAWICLGGSWVIVAAIFNTQVFYPSIVRSLTGTIHRLAPQDEDEPKQAWEWTRLDPSNRLFGWEQVAARVQDLQAESKRQGVETFIAARKYQVGAQLQFHLRGHPESYIFTKRGPVNQYYFINDFDRVLGRDALIVLEKLGDEEREGIPNAFDSVEFIETVDILRRGLKVDEVHIYRGRGFKGWTFKEVGS